MESHWLVVTLLPDILEFNAMWLMVINISHVICEENERRKKKDLIQVCTHSDIHNKIRKKYS